MSLVFLDRDGTLIDTVNTSDVPGSITNLNDLNFRPGAVESCLRLRDAGHVLILVTNQPDIARGIVSYEDVARINEYVKNSCGINQVMMCPHDDEDLCDCRKPKIGMLTRAATDYGIALNLNSVIFGDRWRDIDCGRAAGITAIHVDGGHQEPLRSLPHYHASSMVDAAQWFLQNTKG